MTEETISDAVARVTDKSATEYDLIHTAEVLGRGRRGGCETEIRGRAVPEHRIVLSSSALTRPVDLSYLRTIAESGYFQITVIFLFSRFSLFRSIRGFSFLGPK
jgi:hypothetical protein